MKNKEKLTPLEVLTAEFKEFSWSTRNDMENLRFEISSVKTELNKAVDQVVDRITGHIDGLWGESKRLENVALMQSQRLKDQFEQLNDHERRITALETKA